MFQPYKSMIAKIHIFLLAATGYFYGLLAFFLFMLWATFFLGKRADKRLEKWFKEDKERFDLQDTDEDIPNLYELDREDEDDIMGRWDDQKLGA